MSDAFDRDVTTLCLGPSNVGKTRATASALEEWLSTQGVDGVFVLDFAPEVVRDDGSLLGGRLERFITLPDNAWCGVLEASAPRASATTQQEALAFARRNGANAATLFDAAPRPTALFVNDATIPFQHPAYPPTPLLDLLEDATYAVLNAFESTELGRDDPISRTERETREQLRIAVDPVMVATSGDPLLDEAGERAYEDLLEEATLVTPNYDETLVLTGIDPRNGDAARDAGQRLVEMGADAALVKGGHADGDTVTDVLVTLDSVQEFPHPRVDTLATHGSGCTLSAAITANLARGVGLESAIERASKFMERAIRYPLNVGHGPGTVHHLSSIRNEAARESTAEAVRALVATFVDRDVRPLVPEVGMNVVGATPYAESIEETAAVEGRITRTMVGVMPNRGVRFGASSHLAGLLRRVFAPNLSE